MKKGFLILTMLLILLAVLAACGGGDSEPAPTAAPTVQAEPALPVGDAAKGKEQFTACAACHGPEGEGIQGLGKDMTTSEFIAGLSDGELLEFVKTGRPSSDPLNTTGVDMPPKGGNPALSDAQIMDIIAYIRSIHK